MKCGNVTYANASGKLWLQLISMFAATPHLIPFPAVIVDLLHRRLKTKHAVAVLQELMSTLLSTCEATNYDVAKLTTKTFPTFVLITAGRAVVPILVSQLLKNRHFQQSPRANLM